MSGPTNRGCHPIAQQALDCFPSGLVKNARADKKKLAALEARFSEICKTGEALDAAVTMIRLAQIIEKDAPEAARTVLEVARIAIPALERLTGEGGAELARARASFDKLMGKQSAPRAPMPGGKPAGVSLLAFRARGA